MKITATTTEVDAITDAYDVHDQTMARAAWALRCIGGIVAGPALVVLFLSLTLFGFAVVLILTVGVVATVAGVMLEVAPLPYPDPDVPVDLDFTEPTP